MAEYLEYLKNPLVAGTVSGLVVVLFAYVDQKMNEREFENAYFGKLFVGVAVLVACLVYYAKMGGGSLIQKGGGKAVGGGGGGDVLGSGTKTIVKKLGANGGLDIFTDAPDF